MPSSALVFSLELSDIRYHCVRNGQDQGQGLTAKSVCCAICERLFASESGLRRHKCREERLKPIHEQAGAVLCEPCHRWFASRGGFAVHSCSPSLGNAPVPEIVAPRPPDCSQCQYHCHTCDRCFRSKAGHRRHNCNRRTCSSGSERRTIPCPTCSRKFTRLQYLAQHKCKK